jgi:hypothetical protein
MKPSIKEFVFMVQALTNGDYPKFVLGGYCDRQLPAFVYHKVKYDIFDQHLAHLQRNGYYTLTADEYCQALSHHRYSNSRVVMLTFDDGLNNLFTTVYPLLKKYSFKAVAFIMPAWIGKAGMVTWEQVAEMHSSGLVDFQSHSHHHAAIFVSETVLDFFQSNREIASVPWAAPMVNRAEGDRLLDHSDVGCPIFPAASRMSDARRYFPDPGLEAICMQTVRGRGGEQSLKHREGRRNLLKTIQHYQSTALKRGYYETPEQQRQAICKELTLSKRAIEERLPQKSVGHFSFPWNQSGTVARSLFKECDYNSAYTGLTAGQTRHPVDGTYELPRVNGDFLPRLPGKGRRSLMSILLFKLQRRLTQGEPYW